MRVVNVTEKNIRAQPALPVVLAAATAGDVLPDIAGKAEEIAGRYVQNLTGGVVYYAFGQNADAANNFHGQIADKQQLDCSNHGMRVSCYSVGGGTMAVTILKRIDLTNVDVNIKAAL